MISLADQLEFMRHQADQRRFTYNAREVAILEAVVKTVEKAKMLREVGDEFLAEMERKKNLNSACNSV